MRLVLEHVMYITEEEVKTSDTLAPLVFSLIGNQIFRFVEQTVEDGMGSAPDVIWGKVSEIDDETD